jgi:hypothetical protein
MGRIILEAGQGHRVVIRPHPAGRRLFSEFAEYAPETVELRHVKWSGDALFFVHELALGPRPDEMTPNLELGAFSYFPGLGEFLLAYGDASPRDRRGAIQVAQVGLVSDADGLNGLGERIWRRGAETVRIHVEP